MGDPTNTGEDSLWHKRAQRAADFFMTHGGEGMSETDCVIYEGLLSQVRETDRTTN